jgi:acetyl esterase/lipase
MADQGITWPKNVRGDWKTVRETSMAVLERAMKLAPPTPSVETTIFMIKTKDGAEIELRWSVKKGAPSGPAVIYIHGGGMILGSARLYEPVVTEFVDLSGVPFLSVDYRLAPDVTGTTPAEDAFAALEWLVANAAKLGVDPARIAMMGGSAGGGICAGAVILARERGIPVARQILLYPMLDDRNVVDIPNWGPGVTWSFDDNFTGWNALLGADRGTDRVSPVAAPARLTDFAGLPPTYIEVGELDIFRDESIAYAAKLAAARIPIEFHLHSGGPHAYERIAPKAQISLRAMDDRIRVIKSV